MATVTIEISDLAALIYKHLKPKIEAVKAVANEVDGAVKGAAIFGNEDVEGNQMPQKKPRPKLNPKNNPDIPLIDTGNMMNKSRWTVEDVDRFTAQSVFVPPDYLRYLQQKAPAKGGRPWLFKDKINPKAREAIVRLMKEAWESA